MSHTNGVYTEPISVADSFQAFLVEGAKFTSEEEYPVLESDMIPKELPQKIMPFEKAINFQGDLRDTYICFYSPDATFERVRRNPKKYLNFFKRTAGIIGFDFSVHSDMPIVKQKSQMNDNLSLTYYYGKNGIKIIPNVRCGIDELLPEFLDAIPKNSIIAIGTHGFTKTKQEMCEWYCFLEQVVEVLSPSAVVVYGPTKEYSFEDFANKTEFIPYTPWITERRKKEVEMNVD